MFYFQDADGNQISEITIGCGEEFYYDYSYFGNDELNWSFPAKKIFVDTDKQCITALDTEGSAYLKAENINTGDELGRLTITITKASTGTEDGSDGKGDDTKSGITFQDADGTDITDISLTSGDTYTLSYTSAYESVEFASSNENIVTVTQKRKAYTITAVGSGTAYIIAYGNNQEIGRLTVNVTGTDEGEDDNNDENERVIFYGDEGEDFKTITLSVGTTYTLYYYSSLDDSDTTSWSFNSENNDIATVTADGESCNIYANSSGTTDIVVTNYRKTEIGRLTVNVTGTDEGEDDGKGDGSDEKGDGSDEKGDGNEPTVSDMPSGISFYSNTITLVVGENKTFYYDLYPEGASRDKLVWEVQGKDNIVTVDNYGNVTAQNPGNETIVVYNTNGDRLNECYVTVEQTVTDISIDKTEVTVKAGEYVTLNATVLPEGVKCDVFEWEVSGDACYVYGQDWDSCTLYADTPGEATVQVRTYDYFGNPITASCEVTVEAVPVESISLNETALDMFKGDEKQLSTTIYPDNATNKDVEWSSSDENVVTVGAYGYVRAVGVGTATITATAKDGKGAVAECEVNVKSRYVTGISIDPASLDMTYGDGRYIDAEVEPYNAENTNVDWSSSDESVVTVDEDGYVRAAGIGTATITATAKDGSGVTAECDVTVKRYASLYFDYREMYIGDSIQNYLYTNPEVQEGEIEWSSSNPDVASVDKGNITGVGEGEATITASIEGEVSQTCTVVVRDGAVKGVTLSADRLEVNIGSSGFLKAEFTPDYAQNKNVTWSSSDTSVATVEVYSYYGGDNYRCYVYGHKEGTATITATTEDGGYTASCEVTVSKVPVTGVTLDEKTLEIKWHTYGYLDATVAPDNASYQNVTWSSSNESVARVYNGGSVYGVGEGTAIITATTEEGGYTAFCTVTVTQTHVTEISLNKTDTTLNAGDYETLTVTILPEDADDKSITWISTDPEVASVGWGNRLHAYKEGTATVTATTNDGGFAASCNVTVVPVAVTGITLDNTSITVNASETFWIYPTIAPNNATNKNVTWSSSDTDVIEATGSNELSAKKAGTAIITVTTEDGQYSASCEVNVLLGMDTSDLEIKQGKTAEIDYSYNTALLPEGVSWESSDTSVATVENGVVTAVGGGKATITMSCVYNGTTYTKSCYLNVIKTSGTIGSSNVTWRVSEDEKTLYISGTGELPYQYGADYYDYRDTVTNIVIESGVTELQSYTFEGFEKLKKVTLSDTVTGLSADTFFNCPGFEWFVAEGNTSYRVVDEVLFSYDMKSLCSYPISKTDEKYVVPSTVETIWSRAFGISSNYKNTNLKKLVIDKTVTAIYSNAFTYCEDLKIYYRGSADEWTNISGWYYIYNEVKYNYVDTVNEDGFEYYVKNGNAYICEYTKRISSSTVSLTVPSELGGYPVKVIEGFSVDGVDELIISEGIEKIKVGAFGGFQVSKVVLPSTLNSIGMYAFDIVKKEFSVHEDNANYASVDGVLFSKDKTTLIKYPCQKEGSEYTVPSEVKIIYGQAFVGCTLLENVIISDGVTNIEYFVFDECTNLKSITIPASVTDIAYGVFNNVSALTDVYYGGTEARWNSIDSHSTLPESATIHYGDKEVEPVYVKRGSYTDDGFNYNVYLDSAADGKTVVFALYYKGKLLDCDYKTYNSAENEYLTFERKWDYGTFDGVKAMVWESAESMIPVYAPAVKQIVVDVDESEDGNSTV